MKYTVLLLYPDYMTDGPEGTQTYLAHVTTSRGVKAAQQLAKLHAIKANEMEQIQVDDFRTLFVCNGYQDDIHT